MFKVPLMIELTKELKEVVLFITKSNKKQDVLAKTRTKKRRSKDEKIIFDINGWHSYRFLARSGL
jgi:hypothetical protein